MFDLKHINFLYLVFIKNKDLVHFDALSKEHILTFDSKYFKNQSLIITMIDFESHLVSMILFFKSIRYNQRELPESRFAMTCLAPLQSTIDAA